MSYPLAITQLLTGGICCILGAALGGTAFKEIPLVGSPNQFNSRQEVISIPQPDRPLQVGSGLFLIVLGGVTIGAGVVSLDRAKNNEHINTVPSRHRSSPRRHPSRQQQPTLTQNHHYAKQANNSYPGYSCNSHNYNSDLSSTTATLNETYYQYLNDAAAQPLRDRDNYHSPEPLPTDESTENQTAQTPTLSTPFTENVTSSSSTTTIKAATVTPEATTITERPVYYKPTTLPSPVTQSNATVSYTSKDRYASVRSLVEEGALLIIGGKGSGKTEKLCWVMASHCHQGHWVWFIDPFAPASRYRGLRVFGRGLNYKEAASGLREFVEEANKRIRLRGTDPNYDPFNQLHIHLAIDEMSNYGDRIAQHDETVMQEFWEICTQFLRQANMSVSMVSHGDTQAMMGGEKSQRGKSKAIKRDLVRLYCQWKVDPTVKGKRRCAGWAEKVTVEAGDREIFTKIDIPDWMVAPAGYNYEAIALQVKIASESDMSEETSVEQPNVETEVSSLPKTELKIVKQPDEITEISALASNNIETKSFQQYLENPSPEFQLSDFDDEHNESNETDENIWAS